MSTKFRSTQAEIRLSHLVHNYKVLQSYLRDSTFICPMIKANAYGHGDVEVMKSLLRSGAKRFGVALVEEGVHLRRSGMTEGILVFTTFSRGAVSEMINHNLTPVLSRWEDLEEFERQLPAGSAFSVHLKFNTGMNRLGFQESEGPKLVEKFRSHSKLSLSGVCTHLARGEDATDLTGVTHRQIKTFENIASHFDDPMVVSHVLNSSALCSQAFSGVGARPGIALYGAQPLPDVSLGLRPVMTLRSSVEIVRKVKEGDSVSYGGTWTAPRDSTIGVLPLGYADGLPRSASNKGRLLVAGQKVPIVGRVCMDYTMIDLTDVKDEVHVGEEVVVIGKQGNEVCTVDDLAKTCGTISYEIFTGISSRVPRVYINEGKQ